MGFINHQPAINFNLVSELRRTRSVTNMELSSSIDSINSLLAVDPSEKTFEPMLPDTATFSSIGIVAVLCVVCWFVWNDQVVPISRQKLANSKRKGDVKEYLDELSEGTDTDSRNFEKWLFADWLSPNRKKEAAVPFLKKAKWNSGDNPVLVASALIGFAVLFASVTERIAVINN